MRYDKILTARNSLANCLDCKEPIIKKEGITKWNIGYRCYKCSKKTFIKWINLDKQRVRDLKKANHIGEKRLNEQKIANLL